MSAFVVSAVTSFRVDDAFHLNQTPRNDHDRNLVSLIHFAAAHREIQWIAFVDGPCDRVTDALECLPIKNDMRSYEFKLPYVNRLLQEGRDHSRAPHILYMNMDIVFLENITDILLNVRHHVQKPHLLLHSYAVRFRPGRSYDWAHERLLLLHDLQADNITYEYPGWGCELFVVDRGNPLFRRMPPFLIGRRGWDNWVMQFGNTNPNIMSIDITALLTVVHFDHGGAVAGRDTEAMNGPGAAYNDQVLLDSGGYNYGNIACSKYEASANGSIAVSEPGCRGVSWFEGAKFESIVRYNS